jgi:hypothetical protein
VGSGALQVAAGVGAATHQETERSKREEDSRKSAMDSDDSCNQLEVEVPGVIELRRNGAGTPEYRELQLSDSLDQRQWAPIADQETTADGWRPAVNFLQMDFSPPLGAVVPESASSFLAYAPSQFVSQADSDRLAAMTSNFGKPLGTFAWSGHYYHYVVTSTLPCFPPPPERLTAGAPVSAGF